MACSSQVPKRAGHLIIALLAVTCASGIGLRAQNLPESAPASTSTAADVTLLFGGKKTSRSKVEAQLSAPVRAALDQWAEPADRLELRIAVGGTPEHIVLGHAEDDTLAAAARWMDDTFTLLDPIVPLVGERTPKATVAILVDQEYTRSPAWGELLAELQQQRVLIAQAADYLLDNPEGLTLRQTPMFLQPAYDLTGEGEFQLSNEVAHKYAQCLLTVRTGQQPPVLLWGLGYVVEQQLFESSYHYRLREFVYTSSHFDWKGVARRKLGSHRKDKHFSLVPLATDDEAAGKPETSQIVVWAALSYLAQKEPATLRTLLLDLSALHAENDPSGVAPSFNGDPTKTNEVLKATLDAIALDDLNGWLKEKKKKK